MKVLHVLRSDGFAGVERHIATLAAAQADLGHDVTVVGGDPPQMAAALGDSPALSVPGNSVSEVMAQVRRHGRVDILHAHMTAGELSASLASVRPLVVTRHFARSRGATPVGRAAGAIIRRRISAQIAISEYVAHAIDGPSRVVHPGVPSDEAPARARKPVVLVVQRLQPEKDTDVAIRAFAAGAPDDWTLKVVGRGPELANLRELAEDLGVISRVSFLGFRDDVSDLMRSSAVLLAPCEIEGLGLTVLEAMSHALPVVASQAGAHPETVGRAGNARLFPAGDWHHAGSLLTQLIQDGAARATYGAELQAIQRSDFTPAAQATATDRVYEEALQ